MVSRIQSIRAMVCILTILCLLLYFYMYTLVQSNTAFKREATKEVSSSISSTTTSSNNITKRSRNKDSTSYSNSNTNSINSGRSIYDNNTSTRSSHTSIIQSGTNYNKTTSSKHNINYIYTTKSSGNIRVNNSVNNSIVNTSSSNSNKSAASRNNYKTSSSTTNKGINSISNSKRTSSSISDNNSSMNNISTSSSGNAKSTTDSSNTNDANRSSINNSRKADRFTWSRNSSRGRNFSSLHHSENKLHFQMATTSLRGEDTGFSKTELLHQDHPFASIVNVALSMSQLEKTDLKTLKEIKVNGNTTVDWCVGLKDLYPSVLNISKTEDLKIISAYYNVVNPYSIRFIYNPKRLCASTGSVYLLGIVKSRAENIKPRQAIRHTWGKEAKSGRNRLVFSLGYSSDRKIQRLLRRENSAFKDIIQGNFIDNYYNNTLKTTMGIHWISTFCSSARFVFFVDDDVLVNFKNLLAFYRNVSTTSERSLFSGNLKVLEGPFRDEDSPYYMPISIYPYNCYPAYISGAVILTSGYVVQMLDNVIPYVKRFKYDDVFIALVIQKLGILPQNNNLVSIPKKEPEAMKYMIASHGFKSANEYIRTYRNMTI